MPQALPAIIGAGASLFGGRQQRNAQQDAIVASSTELGDFFSRGPGGVTGGFRGGNEVIIDPGDLEGVRKPRVSDYR